MADYQPTQQDVQQAIQLLMTAGTPTVTGDDKKALELIEGMKQTPQFFAVLSHILAKENNPQFAVARQQAGLLLKNNMKYPACAGHPVVQSNVLAALGDPLEGIRRAVATAISTAVLHGQWPVEVAQNVLGGLRGDANAIHGSLTAICDLCEDCVQLLGSAGATQHIIPALIPFLGGAQPPQYKKKAVHAISVLIEEAGHAGEKSVTYQSLQPQVPSLLALLIELSNATDMELTANCYVVRCFVLLVTFHQEMKPQFDQVVNIMCQKSISPQEEVRKEAVEFWQAVLYVPEFSERTLHLMPQVINVLLSCMIYSDMEYSMLDSSQNDFQVPDKAEDIKPQKHAVRHRAIGDEGDDAEDDEVAEDSLRANAGLTLDKCAEHYGTELLSHVLTIVQQKLSSPNFKEVEAAIMAVGAIADGCYEGMKQYLPMFVTKLDELLEDEQSHFLVKCICLWVLGQYSYWFGEESQEAQVLLPRTITVILLRMVSPTKKLQEAAAACLGVFAKNLENRELEPDAPKIVETCANCFRGYQLKNRYLLFETVNHLAIHLGSRLAEEDCLNPLMNPLLQLWKETPDDSHLLYPYFRCMAGVCEALGSSILPMAAEIYQRSFALALNHARLRSALKQNPNADVPEDEFLVTALDLLSGLSSAIEGSIVELVNQDPNSFTECMGHCLYDESSGVRGAALAVLGDLASAAPQIVQSLLPHLDTIFVDGLSDPENRTLEASNLTWLLHDLLCNQVELEGVACLTSAHLERYLPSLVRCITLRTGEGMLNMAQNAAMAIGRFLYVDPTCADRTGQAIDQWCGKWFELVRHIKSSYFGKEPAVRGVLAVLSRSPAAAVPCLNYIFDTAVSFGQPSVEIQQELQQFFNGLKGQMGAQWSAVVQQYDRLKQPKLRTMYGVTP